MGANTLSDQDIVDLVTGTLKELGRMKFQQIAQNLQSYEVFSRWMTSDKVAVDSGIGIQRTLMVKLSNAFKWVGLFEQDEVNVIDLLTQMNVPWRHATTNWAFERRELLMNSGASLVTKIIEPRRAAAMINLVEGLEVAGFTCPDVNDTKTPWGAPYWVVKNATVGFNGGAPSGYTTVAGVNPTTYPKWKNYSGAYTAVTGTGGLVQLLRSAHRKIGWKSPVDINDYRTGTGRDLRFYVNESLYTDFEAVYETRNDNLGPDLGIADGMITFKRHPIIWIPQLDADTSNPIYGIDHATFNPVVLAGDFLRESEPKPSPKQHNVMEVHVDLTINFVCIDRRRNMVMYKAA